LTIALSLDFLQAYAALPREQQKKVREFTEQFQQNPERPGYNYEAIESARDKSLFSVRINQGYRAIVFHPSGSDVHMLAWVDRHDDAYDWAASRSFQVNPLTGALQVLNAAALERPAPKPTEKSDGGLFRLVKDKHLLRLGIPETLLNMVRGMETDGDLERAEGELPQEVYEALFLLASGYSVDDVFREMEKPQEQPNPIDTTDFASALLQEDSQRRFFVTDDSKEFSEILNAPLDQWRVFLHPKQRKLISMNANGPVRVLGGAGTGKTVAAMHRAKHLAESVFTEKDERILFTTFTRNLATDIAENLRKLCSPEVYARIEVVNLDQWVDNFLRTQGYRHKTVFGEENNECWRNALQFRPENLGLPEGFYRTEWEDVVQAQDITSAEQYIKAARLGRGTRLSREQKKRVWTVFEEYRAQLNEHGQKEFVDLIRDSRSLIESKQLKLPYRSAVIDEAQDFSAEAFRLLRAMIPTRANDLFIVGDAHQRIYRNRVTLGRCGIDIRGRGKTLKLNYRTTGEIRRLAVNLLEGRPVDDLDGGLDTQKGYMSVRAGVPPVVKHFRTFGEEAAFLKARIDEIVASGDSETSICLVGRTHQVLEFYATYLRENGIAVYEVKRSAAEQREKPGVRVATMHRVKGLEFEHIFVVSMNKGIVPLTVAVESGEDAVARRNAETVERSLVYVALTRSKKTAAMTGYGEPSPFMSGWRNDEESRVFVDAPDRVS
jgi:superfamily I DNA/RNA helicase